MSKDGGPAFPAFGMAERDGKVFTRVMEPGMSLRDWFAGMAMQELMGKTSSDLPWRGGETLNETRARVAYATADAMLAERVK